MKSNLIAFASLILLLSLCVQPAFADGGFWKRIDPDLNEWSLADETQQFAMINYDGGIEKMLLTVDVKDIRGWEGVWIFPVPADPEKSNIKITQTFPVFGGDDFKEEVDEKIGNMFLIMSASQLYPAPVVLLSVLSGVMKAAGFSGGEVQVYQHIEKAGLTAELVSTKDANALYYYLVENHLNIPDNAREIIDQYTSKNYSFVLVWVSNVGQARQSGSSRLGVLTTFPTDKIYFPLKLTSLYGDAKIPIIIYVSGHVAPEIYPSISGYTQVGYFTNAIIDRMYKARYQQGIATGVYPSDDTFDEVWSMVTSSYTKISMDAPSSAFKEDLWMQNAPPIDLALSSSFNNALNGQGYMIILALLFAITSCSASLVAGVLVFKNEVPKEKLALLGLANFFTLIGVWLAARTIKTPSKLGSGFTWRFTILFLAFSFVYMKIVQFIF